MNACASIYNSRSRPPWIRCHDRGVAKGCPTDTLVKPSLPDQRYLVWKRMGAGPCFQGVKMPPGGGISEGDLNTVRGWIMAGALNN